MSSLRCSLCRRDVPDGFCQCPFCNVGFTAVLECASCGAHMQPGSTTCFRCGRTASSQSVLPSSNGITAVVSAQMASPQLAPQVPQVGAWTPGLVPAARVEETYLAGRYGVESEVQIPAGDVEVMNLMAQAANALQLLAAKMNGFRGHMELTRANIRACRSLAADLQEEIELRRGPRG